MAKPEQAPQAAPARPTQAQVSTTKAVSGPSAPQARHKVDVPAGWGDTVHETSWTPPEESVFGAATFQGPDGMPTEAPFVPTTEVTDPAVTAKKPVEDDAETPGPETVKTDSEHEQPLTEGEQGDPAENAAKTKLPEATPPVESNSMVRRKALDAMRLEAENRALQERLKGEQDARKADRTDAEARVAEREARLERLRSAPLEERLQAIGISSREALQETVIRGEVPDFKAPEPVAPVVDDGRVARLEAELATFRIESKVRHILQQQGSTASVETVMAEAARTFGKPISTLTNEHVEHINNALATVVNGERSTGAALNAIKAELSNVEVHPAPNVRVTEGALDAVTNTALNMWRSGGSKPGEFVKYAKFALEAAEEMYAERYAPIKALAGGAAAAAPAAKKPAAPAAAFRPSPPIGKRVAARAPVEEEDEGPMDPALRDAWIRDSNRKAGRSGW